MEISAQSLISKRYGVATTERENPLITTVGVTADQVLPGNPRRLAAVITNLSANTMYVAPEPDVSASKGILLGANGGSISMTLEDDFTLVTRAWYVIATAAASAIYAVSVVIYGPKQT